MLLKYKKECFLIFYEEGSSNKYCVYEIFDDNYRIKYRANTMYEAKDYIFKKIKEYRNANKQCEENWNK